jgi:hypothetical protein
VWAEVHKQGYKYMPPKWAKSQSKDNIITGKTTLSRHHRFFGVIFTDFFPTVHIHGLL